ncbi:MAG: hypothetical protein U0401_05660 [Anaerolineae bacterium]
MKKQIHVGVLVEQRYLTQVQPHGLSAILQAQGHRVTLLDPQAAYYELGNPDWLDNFDLIVARGRSWALLSLLAWAEIRKTPTINRRAAVAAVHNKADMAVTLATGGLPTPRTLFGPVEHLAVQLSDTYYPLILKPIFGDNCRGLRVVNVPGELAGLKWPEPVALAQHYLPNDGYDLKLYGIGDEVWAVRKPSPHGNKQRSSGRAKAHSPKAELLPLTPALRQLAERCRTLFGLDLFGVDCIQTLDGPVVIEVNDFPNYTGVPQADEHLAEYVISKAC